MGLCYVGIDFLTGDAYWQTNVFGREGDKRGNNNNDNSDDEFIFLHIVLFSALRSAQL
jgi:hypothetical protein